MNENKRFTVHIVFSNLEKTEGEIELKDNGQPLLVSECVEDVRYLKDLLNELHNENEQLKQQKIELLRLIDNNIEIYENINTNVEFHQGEIQGKLTLLYNLREVILND